MLALSFSDMMIPAIIGGVVIFFIIAFVITGFVKGLFRMALGLIFLAAGMAAGQWGLWKGSSIAGTFVDRPDPWMSAAVAVIVGLATFFVARALIGVILHPLRSGEARNRRLGAPGGILGLLMGAAFAWFCLSGVRYVGTISELAWLQAAVESREWLNARGVEAKASTRPTQPLFSKIKREIDDNAIGQLHGKYDDFLNSRAHANLAKLSIIFGSEQAGARVRLVPAVRAATDQEQIRNLLENKNSNLKAFHDYSQLLHSELIRETCRSDEVQELLADLDLEKALGLAGNQADEKK